MNSYPTLSHTHRPLKVGFFSVGLDTYWPQFAGLRERLVGYGQRIASKLSCPGVEIVDLGLIDNPEDAATAGHQFRQSDVSLIFLYIATYALSSTVLPAVRRARVPIIVLNLSPGPAIDYERFNSLPSRREMTGEWLAWCQSCSAPEIANVFNRCGIPFFPVSGMLDEDPAAWSQIDDWLDAARAVHVMEQNRLGAMGHYYNGMLDIYADFTQQCAQFGGHIEIIEVEELAAIRREVSDADTRACVDVIKTAMDVREDCPQQELTRAARTAVALDRLAEKHTLGSLAYYHEGTGNPEHEDVMSSVILGASLLTARGIPIAGEYEIKNAQAMKIMDALGAGGSFTEYYAVDFNEDVILMGHDGPGHIAIAAGKTKVRPLEVYHGKVGQGLSVEMSVKHGPVTLLAVVQTREAALKLLVAEGHSVPGPILQIGNTNSRYRFPIGARKFMDSWNSAGPAHHCAVGLGHIAGKLRKVALLLGMEAHFVC